MRNELAAGLGAVLARDDPARRSRAHVGREFRRAGAGPARLPSRLAPGSTDHLQARCHGLRRLGLAPLTCGVQVEDPW